MIALEKLGRNPGRVIAALCAAQAVVWTLAPALTHDAPPLDVVEMLAWGRAGVVATYKHPNLPGLVLDSVRRLAGGALWPAYLVSQAFICASFVAVYLLGRDLLGPARALAGTLLLTGIFYYSWPSPEMNHNIAQIPLWAGICLALWRAARGGRTLWWIALGVLAGLSIWAKYSAGILLVVALGWMVWDASARARFRTAGPWLALAAFALIAAPQVRFLIETDMLAIDYARTRASAGSSGAPHGFLLTQIADHGVFFVMAAIAGLLGAGAARHPAEGADERRFLAVLGLGPVLLAAALAGVSGMGLKDMWGTPMFGLSGLLFLAFLPGRFGERALGRLVGSAAVLLVLVPVAYAAQVVFAAALSDKPLRVAWPQDAIVRSLVQAYESRTGAPPRIIAGPIWEAGLIAARAPGAPTVMIDGAMWKSPWVSAADISRHGALAVWPADTTPADTLKALIDGRPIEHRTFRWSDSPTARPIRISYAIIPPIVLGRDRERRRTGLADR